MLLQQFILIVDYINKAYYLYFRRYELIYPPLLKICFVERKKYPPIFLYATEFHEILTPSVIMKLFQNQICLFYPFNISFDAIPFIYDFSGVIIYSLLEENTPLHCCFFWLINICFKKRSMTQSAQTILDFLCNCFYFWTEFSHT